MAASKTKAKSTAKKPAKKAAPAKKPAKKSAAKPAKKAAKKAAKKPAKKAAKKPAKKAAVKPAKKPAKKPARKSAASAPKIARPAVTDDKVLTKSPFKKRELKEFRQLLLNIRDQIVDDIQFLAGDNLNRSQRDSTGDLSSYSLHMADQGTDNFDREFALNLVSSEQNVLYEVEEAMRRIDEGVYGICEASGYAIETERLRAIPYARNSVKAQEELERGRGRGRRHTPAFSAGD